MCLCVSTLYIRAPNTCGRGKTKATLSQPSRTAAGESIRNVLWLQLRTQLPVEGAEPFPLRLQVPAPDVIFAARLNPCAAPRSAGRLAHLLEAGAAPTSPEGRSLLPRTHWHERHLQSIQAHTLETGRRERASGGRGCSQRRGQREAVEGNEE